MGDKITKFPVFPVEQVNRDALGPAQQPDHLGLLRGARGLWIGESFQRRPQAIDQRLAIADLAQPVDLSPRGFRSGCAGGP